MEATDSQVVQPFSSSYRHGHIAQQSFSSSPTSIAYGGDKTAVLGQKAGALIYSVASLFDSMNQGDDITRANGLEQSIRIMGSEEDEDVDTLDEYNV
ncbi:hypothetical protein KIN20_006610 [Parelaphostrongylus tenuis]|uniref:Uncharacterized protein n=1 Tax=Parelaphostrongylus tenuis TaxID=148309 RepID=A0AAD5QIG9_PARTN|nr:hypothetical protein KIN20_006610 [Parelaphostrongylus tenuis]